MHVVKNRFKRYNFNNKNHSQNKIGEDFNIMNLHRQKNENIFSNTGAMPTPRLFLALPLALIPADSSPFHLLPRTEAPRIHSLDRKITTNQ